MEITREEQQLLTEFRRLTPQQRQELIVVARGLAATTATPPANPDAASGQCVLGRHPARTTADNDPVITE